VSSPEFCFFQLADEYNLAKLIALGIELCGSYALPSKKFKSKDNDTSGQTSKDYDASTQSSYDLTPLTSKRKLKGFTDRMEGWPGYRQAIKALRYIEDGSASPMETILFILLTLPYRYGGYGIPKPELNGRIYPKKGVKKFSGRSFYRGDLLWREAGVVAEYNSDTEHSGSERIASDAIRRSDLDLCGIYEVTVTKGQMRNVDLFDKVARQIAVRVGKKLRYNDSDFSEKRKELRGFLFAD